MRMFYGSENSPNRCSLPIKEMAHGGRMDNEEFKRRLSEVAEWKLPDTPRETSLNAKKKRGRKSNEEQYMELREEIFHEEFGGVNQTYPPMLVRLKCQPVDCEDCGNSCPNGRKKETKLYETGAKKTRNWRERCITCGLHKNPFTGKFELSSQESSYVWTEWLRDRKGEYKSKFAKAKEEIESRTQTNGGVSIETDTAIITYYPDSGSMK